MAKAAITAWYSEQGGRRHAQRRPIQQPVAAEAVRQAPRAQFHRRTGAGQARKPEPASLAAGRPTTSSSAGRISTRSACCPRPTKTRSFLADTSRRQARPADRVAAARGPSSSTIGPTNGPTCCWSTATSCRRPATPTGHVVLLPLDPQPGRGRHALGLIRPRVDHGHGQHARKRRDQLLRPAPGSARPGRNHHRGLPGHVDQLRPLPQPSAGEVDQRPVLRHGQSVRPRAHEERQPTAGEPDRLPVDRRRADPAAHRQAAAAYAAGRPAAGLRFARSIAACTWPTG